MTKEIWLSLLRKLLVALGAWLASRGLPGIDDKLAGDAAGALLILGSAGWGWWNARQKRTLKDAVSGDIPIDHPKVTAIVPEPAPQTTAQQAQEGK